MLKLKQILPMMAMTLAAVQGFAFQYNMTITATRGPGLDPVIWNSLRGSLEQAYASIPNPQGVNFNFTGSDSELIWQWNAPDISVEAAREFRDNMQGAFDEANQQYQEAGLDIIWTFDFQGEGSTPVESARFDYPDAADLGNGWVYYDGFGAFNVNNWPWVFNELSLSWYYNAGTANNLWCYIPADGWGYTNAALYPWVFINDQGQWVYTGAQ